MESVRVKICGMTRAEDVRAALRHGADAIGLVFYEPSPRYVSIELARELAFAAGPLVTVVGLFVDAAASDVENICAQVPLNLLQFHGNESLDYCEQFNRPYIKAFRMRPDLNVRDEIDRFPSASGLLLDAYRKGIPGGTGETFDWARVPKDCSRPIILAGGLGPQNIQEAITQTRPYAVDVSGGVEVSPGVKDRTKIAAFIANAKAGER